MEQKVFYREPWRTYLNALVSLQFPFGVRVVESSNFLFNKTKTS